MVQYVQSLDRSSCHVLTFSHFLPTQAILPEKRFLFFPNLAKAVGSLPLEARVMELAPDVHVFGHTHFAWDMSVAGRNSLRERVVWEVYRGKCVVEVWGAS